MKTIKLEIELTYDDEGMHSGDDDKDAKEWFFNDVLAGELELFDKSELGDEIGKVKILSTDCGWISVEDELPLGQDYQSAYLGVEVLVTDGKNTAVEIFCIGGNHIGKPWAHFSDYSNIEDITHWMPLPKPPEV